MMVTLRELREDAQKSAKEVANALCITKTALYNYERGIRRIPLEAVLQLASLYNCTEREVIQAQMYSELVFYASK